MSRNEYKKYRESRFYGLINELVTIKEELGKNGVHFLFFQMPLKNNISNLTKFEEERLKNWEFDFNHIVGEDLEKIKMIYGADVYVDYLQQVYDGVKVYEKNGIKNLSDFRSPLVNIINGKRITLFQPTKFHNSVLIFGQCTARGTGVKDQDTIPSILQKVINENIEDSYRVENYAIGCGSDLHDDIAHMKKLKYREGDVVVLCTNLEIVPIEVLEEKKIPFFDTSILFHRPHDYGEWFTDMTFHTNQVGNKRIAEYIFTILNDKNIMKREANRNGFEFSIGEHRIDCDLETEELHDYIEKLKEEYFMIDSHNGAIVMNCNPFTYGHQYLIENAARQVDYLYIFVVQEDKSFFSFKDRYALIKNGTKQYSNVIVIPSGNFIISAITFPGYFNKDNENTIQVDTSNDIRIFGKYIAPALNITVRFAGNEPIDYITRQYNEEMAKTLPLYGIQFQEITRKECGNEIISASYVRELLKNQEWNKIKSLVPISTYEYLSEKFKE